MTPDTLTDTCLPPRSAFKNELSMSEISSKDYDQVLQFWTTLNLQTLQDFHDIYLKIDILTLVDIFQEYRSRIHCYYKLEPLQYYTTPGISFDAALKFTGVELQLISDPDMYLFFEK